MVFKASYVTNAVERACNSGDHFRIRAAAKKFLASFQHITADDSTFILNMFKRAKYNDRMFWKRATELLVPRVSEMHEEVLGMVANDISMIKFRVPGFFPALSEEIMQRYNKIPGKTLASAERRTWENKYGKHRGKFLQSQSVGQSLPQHQGTHRSDGAEVPKEVIGHDIGDLVNISPRNLALVTHAFARTLNRDEVLLKSLKNLIIMKMEHFQPQPLGMIAGAYARVGLLDAELMTSIAGKATRDLERQLRRPGHPFTQKRSDMYDHFSVTTLLNAHAKARLFDSGFFTIAMDWMSPGLVKTFTPQSLSLALHAFSVFPEMHQTRRSRVAVHALFATFTPVILWTSHNASVQNLVNVIHAFSIVGLRDVVLLGKAVPVLYERRDLWNTQDVANLSSSLLKLDFIEPNMLLALSEKAANLMAQFKNSELATVLNGLAHYIRRGSHREWKDGNALEMAYDVFTAAATRINRQFMSACATFYVALILSSWVKVEHPDQNPIKIALDELELREITPPSAALILNALARLQMQPSPKFLEGGANLALSDHGESSWKQMGTIRTVNLLNALVRLDAVFSQRGVLHEWLSLLVKRVYELCPDKVRVVDQDVFNSTNWSQRTLATGLDVMCKLECGCGSMDCALCGPYWWRCVESLFETALALLESNPTASGDRVLMLQTRRSLLLLHNIHFRYRTGEHCGLLHHCQPSLRLARACKGVLGHLYDVDASSSVTRFEAKNADEQVAMSGLDDAQALPQILESLSGMSASNQHILELYHINVLVESSSVETATTAMVSS